MNALERYGVAVVCFALSALDAGLAQGVPTSVPYTGHLAYATGAPYNGVVSMEARLYSSVSGDDLVWGPQVFPEVEVAHGILSFVLTEAGGQSVATAFSSEPALWLALTVNEIPMIPRQHVLSVPWALVAQEAETLGGIAPSDVLTQGNVNILGSLSVNGHLIVDESGELQGAGGGSGESATTGPLTLYVNGSTGADTNDGLSALAAKKTIQAAIDAIPRRVKHRVEVRIAPGTYRDMASATCNTEIDIDSDHSCNVLITGFDVSTGSINLIGDPLNPSSVRITGSNAAADTVAVRDQGIVVRDVFRVGISGVRIDRFVLSGIFYELGATGVIADSEVFDNARGVMCIENSRCQGNRLEIHGNSSVGFFGWMHARALCRDCNIGRSDKPNAQGVRAARTAEVMLDSCRVRYSTINGVSLDHLSWVQITNTQGTGSTISNGTGTGILVGSSSYVNMSDTTVSNNTSNGIYVIYQSSVTSSGVTGSGNGGYGVYVDHQSMVTGFTSNPVGGALGPLYAPAERGALSL